MTKLDKQQSRKRWRELRDLWNKFDPIGVYSIDEDWPLDEYESYCGTHMRLLETNATTEEIIQHIYEVLLNMGIEKTDNPEKLRAFAEETQAWYQESCKDT